LAQRRDAVQGVTRERHAAGLARGEQRTLLRQGQLMQLLRCGAHSITFGTRKRPPSRAGALAMLASRASVSVTASSRRRRVTSSMADRGVYSGATPEVSTARIFSTM